ncbi:SDR family oxidoreductase [Candidatus Curtissbacteria bacterium]|nr:SDR family oxidoreductase [Candidatus Curtissbacteria bacterium]
MAETFVRSENLHLFAGKNVVITGTSRGIGARGALAFAGVGADVVGTFANPDPKSSKRQDWTVRDSKIINPDMNFTSVQMDISNPEHRKKMIAEAVGGDIDHPTKKIDVLVLNAAGGLEENSDEDWADEINCHAQLALVAEALPYMAEGAKIIYLQSLWAHYFGQTMQLALYESIARTKHMAEQSLRFAIPELAAHGVKVGIIVGDAIQNTSQYAVFKSMLGEEFTSMEESIEGGFPTADTVGATMVDMALTNWESGHTKYLGRNQLEPFDTKIIGRKFNRRQIAQKLPMYSDATLFVNTSEITGMDTGTATYTVRPQEYQDHFVGPFEDIKLEPLHYLTEIAAQAAGLVVSETRMVGDGAPLYRSVDATVDGMVFPDEKLTIKSRISKAVSGGVICTAEIFGQDGTKVATFKRIKFDILPTKEMAWRLYRRARAARGMDYQSRQKRMLEAQQAAIEAGAPGENEPMQFIFPDF